MLGGLRALWPQPRAEALAAEAAGRPDRGQRAAWRPPVADRRRWSASQTLLSNGVGASVGLEAGYTQPGGGLASRLGSAFALRRGDLRVLVGCGAAAAIGAAFDAPLTGAFYAFELVIGTYRSATLFPVVGVAPRRRAGRRRAEAGTYRGRDPRRRASSTRCYAARALLGVLCGRLGILLMRGVARPRRCAPAPSPRRAAR